MLEVQENEQVKVPASASSMSVSFMELMTSTLFT
jgi:hypothetical protein